MSQNSITYTVSDLVAVVNQTLEYAYPNVIVEGEVSSFKINQGKFVFFDIKDNESIIGCFMMAFSLRMPIEDGMKVILSGSLKLTNKGKFSLIVKSIKPSGEGSIKKSFDLLKEKLDKEGLFEEARKRSLPTIPERVVVISSVQAAGYADFIKIVNDRWSGIKIDVLNVAVQGVDAADQIIKAIEYVGTMPLLPDVLVLIRGGGSADDLATFNDEKLVRTLAMSRVPTLVGVGHETDLSLCDLVADKSAVTPSNAAQILVPDKSSVLEMMRNNTQSISRQVDSAIDALIQKIVESISGLGEDIVRDVQGALEANRLLQATINSLNPVNVLARGYGIVRGEASIGSSVEVELIDKIITAKVEDVRKK